MADIELTHDQWMSAKIMADARMKATNGHYFVVMLKTRCQHCGRSPKVKTHCSGWFQTYLSHLDTIVLNVDREFEDA